MPKWKCKLFVTVRRSEVVSGSPVQRNESEQIDVVGAAAMTQQGRNDW